MFPMEAIWRSTIISRWRVHLPGVHRWQAATMSIQTRKHRGYKTQRNVAEYMASLFPNAYAAGAGQSGSDILGTPFNIEVKARTGFEPLAAFRQLDSRSDGRFGIVVLRCNGQGDDAGEYLVMARLKDFMPLLADTWEGK
jgi:hypothetical protein